MYKGDCFPGETQFANEGFRFGGLRYGVEYFRRHGGRIVFVESRAGEELMVLARMDFVSFGVDPSVNAPALILRERGGTRTLTVPMGPFEASVVAMDSLGVAQTKPMGVELARLIMEGLGGKLQRVVLSQGTEPEGISARLHISGPSGMVLVVCSASHGVVMALRCDAPVFASEELLESRAKEKLSARQALRQHIASLDTLDFGTYTLE